MQNGPLSEFGKTPLMNTKFGHSGQSFDHLNLAYLIHIKPHVGFFVTLKCHSKLAIPDKLSPD
jgi:hypothetical protein